MLSTPAEGFTNQVYQVARSKFRQGTDIGFEYIFSPIVIVLVIITVLSIAVGLRQAKLINPEGKVNAGHKRAPMFFLFCIVAYLIATYWNASLINDRLLGDKIFPMFVAAVGLVASLMCLVRMIRAPETDVIFADKELEDGEALDHGLWTTMGWFAGLLIMTLLLGFILALLIFLFTFMRRRAGLGNAMAAIYTACGIGLICLMAWLLRRDFPPGLLQEFVDLPWPLT